MQNLARTFNAGCTTRESESGEAQRPASRFIAISPLTSTKVLVGLQSERSVDPDMYMPWFIWPARRSVAPGSCNNITNSDQDIRHSVEIRQCSGGKDYLPTFSSLKFK